ncbi:MULTISPECIES: MFS transporter [unclassified Pseudomonas]|uniref:MFS transporter n=1 Tax=unclassified Pseudomonas TaxID=196821 RepID=UPI000BC3BFDF|nr:MULTISPECIES: MFS transporter [unclassified Pseudomonas]PVZ16209.1 AAHS family 4-hydroxybenzoate transporter-like MFS transporter [Pseudomonas sp. URIL14HWK12:I12]PVZ25935.1 AAHS family 4-hydroxybenzoate transporter-like MFS transporter [Pseudomonas sp. URIL14HWK12:I10]PVZ36541.1 AAHS family 4-hydroxybenzoate transporter-like MFS transporter [Pseudomonas sp. URIL14HWK12:I11]SNZ13224.1 MFS transporter, AAHS family, 4-hydroxybenzoate transporter [Pseudomonas sp. URIL14HWK12:I9]
MSQTLTAAGDIAGAPAQATSPAGTLDVQQFINAQPLSRYQWRIALLCFLIVFLDGLDTAAMGFIAPALSQDWGINRAQLGPVMSAALIGMVFGALGSGPLADRFGRKGVLVVSAFLFGIFSLACAFSANLEQLVLLRFLTGLGLGAAMPNATTLLSEYTPERLKSLLVTSMFCGFNLGMAGGGFISAWLIPSWGWHSLLLVGGVLPLLLALALAFWLPESARFMVVRGQSAERVRKVLRPIGEQAAQAQAFSVPEQQGVKARNVFAVIFGGVYSAGTLLLWLTYFMGLVIVYLLTSWLPTLMRESGASLEQAAFIGALFQFGGVLSSVAVGWAMDRFNPHKVIGVFYLLAGLFAWAVGKSLGDTMLLATLVLAAGMCVNGAQSAMPSLAARFYPTHGRATGVSWMLGVGRFGAILGAWIGATLLGMGWHFEQVLTALLVPAVLASGAVLIKGMTSHADAT